MSGVIGFPSGDCMRRAECDPVWNQGVLIPSLRLSTRKSLSSNDFQQRTSELKGAIELPHVDYFARVHETQGDPTERKAL